MSDEISNMELLAVTVARRQRSQAFHGRFFVLRQRRVARDLDVTQPMPFAADVTQPLPIVA